MEKEDLESLLETLKYGLNYCDDRNGNTEKHFNSFANAINIVEYELNLLYIISIRDFNEDCKLYFDNETDEWVLKYKGVVKKRSKSEFECQLTKKTIEQELGI